MWSFRGTRCYSRLPKTWTPFSPRCSTLSGPVSNGGKLFPTPRRGVS
ncbi:Uncharacterised protein [Mycobacteroides abscessus subsp. abscessus]|nr:Uncharacterised protein [Mycobacteroides abscessus subsp. abscessus]